MQGPTRIRRRESSSDGWALASLHPLVARAYALRGIADPLDCTPRLGNLSSPEPLGGLARACDALESAIGGQQRICVVGDFDCDGATGTAVAVRGLRLLGARNVSYRVPHRQREGYGLTPELVDALDPAPDWILTVDNGIASHAGVARAGERGIRVIVTDHHLPGDTLPDAEAIVNPNLPGDAFPSKALAGVGVVFYLLLALRMRRRTAGAYRDGREPDLASLLDLVALGTVADLVALDYNNRILVEAGLCRIRDGRASAGIAALFTASGRDPQRAVASDLGFALGPRINAAGRLEDMRLGIECLLTDDGARAQRLAAELSAINLQRQELQSTMVEQGEAMVARFLSRFQGDALPFGVVLHESDWHPGVVGLVASKLKERLHRPVIAFAGADSESGTGAESAELRGSARSIVGFHLRDALAEVDALNPGLITRFGGHAMAAGLTLPQRNLGHFAAEFDAVARRRLGADSLESWIWSDGELAVDALSEDAARALRYAGPWGQGFDEPAFDNLFDVVSWRAVGERHLRLQLRLMDSAATHEAIFFNALEFMPPPSRLRAVYQLDLNEWNGRERLQLVVRHIEPA